jgi:hypothetical protein
VRQEAQTRETQRQLDTLLAAQAAALAAATANGADTLSSADIAGMRQQLVLAQAQLQQQYKELEEAQANFKQQQSLLKEAAGALCYLLPWPGSAGSAAAAAALLAAWCASSSQHCCLSAAPPSCPLPCRRCKT